MVPLTQVETVVHIMTPIPLNVAHTMTQTLLLQRYAVAVLSLSALIDRIQRQIFVGKAVNIMKQSILSVDWQMMQISRRERCVVDAFCMA